MSHKGNPAAIPENYWRELWRYSWQSAVTLGMSLAVALAGLLSEHYVVILLAWLSWSYVTIRLGKRFARNVKGH